jgi:hypothetical protein
LLTRPHRRFGSACPWRRNRACTTIRSETQTSRDFSLLTDNFQFGILHLQNLLIFLTFWCPITKSTGRFSPST